MKQITMYQSDDGKVTGTEQEVHDYENPDYELPPFIKYRNYTEKTGIYLLVLKSGYVVSDVFASNGWRNYNVNEIVMRSKDPISERLAQVVTQ